MLLGSICLECLFSSFYPEYEYVYLSDKVCFLDAAERWIMFTNQSQWHFWERFVASKCHISVFTLKNNLICYFYFIYVYLFFLSFYPSCPLHLYHGFQLSVCRGFLSVWMSGSLSLYLFLLPFLFFFSYSDVLVFILY